MTAQEIIDDILRREGGYIDHPADRGGPTNYGITLATLTTIRERPVTVDELKALTPEQAREIYMGRYLVPFDFITDNRLLELIVDCAVNHGTGRATKWLQEALGVKPDGIIGVQTRRAAAQAEPSVVYRIVLRRRIVFYGQIIKNDPKQSAFAEGWARRVAEFV